MFFYGVEDRLIDKWSSKFHTFEGTFVKTKTFAVNERIKLKKKLGYGITNFKITGKYDRVRFIVGGNVIDTLKYGLGTIFTPQAYVFPFLKYHDIDFRVEGQDGPIQISLDYVKLNNFDEEKEYIVRYTQTQYQEERLVKGPNNIRLHFVHPVTKLYLVNEMEASLDLDGYTVKPGVFEESINFSKVTNARLHVNAGEEFDTTIVVEYIQLFGFAKGMMGPMYSM